MKVTRFSCLLLEWKACNMDAAFHTDSTVHHLPDYSAFPSVTETVTYTGVGGRWCGIAVALSVVGGELLFRP